MWDGSMNGRARVERVNGQQVREVEVSIRCTKMGTNWGERIKVAMELDETAAAVQLRGQIKCSGGG